MIKMRTNCDSLFESVLPTRFTSKFKQYSLKFFGGILRL